MALVDTSLAGPQPLTVATPFGVSDPVDFTFIAEYKPTVESFSVDSPSPTVGDTITYSWQVDDLAGDAISCEVQTNDLTIYKIEDCRATTSQTHTFTALPSNAYSYLRLADENALRAAKQLRVNVQPSAPAPVLELLSPDRGPADGGNTITITGQNLTGTSRVMFDGADATDFNVDSDTQITATVVRGVNSDYVTVFVPEGGTSNRLTYKYVRTPIISSLSPAEGLPGDTVTVSGSYIGDVEAVNVGVQAAQFTIVATNKLTFVVPEGEPGLFDVTLSAVGETSVAKSFTYLEKPVPTPILNTISPDKGSSAGGTNITLSGENLADALSVTFGGQDVSFTQDSDTQVTVTSLAGTGTAEITVATAGGKSNALSFNYIEPPVLTGISPNEGPTAGGTEVTLMGENLSDVTEVRFGNIVSQSFAVVSDTKIVAVSPRGQEGTFGITVSNLDDTSDTLRFTYIKPLTQIPEIRSFEISPSISVVGEDVKVTWLVEDPDSTSLTCKLVFDNTTKVIDDCINTSTESYTFSQSGDFSISLEVSDGENTNSITKDISIADLPTPELSDFTDAEVATAWNVVENTPEFNRLSLNAETSEGVAWKTQGYVMMYLPEVGSYRYIQALVLDGVAVDILRHSFDINARTVTISHILSGIGVTLLVDELASMSVDALATQLLPFYQHSAFTTSRISTPSSLIQTQAITACPQCDDKIIDYGKKAKAAANFSSNLLLNTLYIATPAYVLVSGFAPVPVCGILISGALGSVCNYGFTAAALVQFTRYMVASGAAYKSYFAVKDCFTVCQPNYQIGRGPIAIATPPLPIVRTSFVQSLAKASSTIIGQGPGQTEDDVYRLLSQPSIVNAASSSWEINAQFDNVFIKVCRTYPDSANRVMGADWATSCN